MNSIGLVEVKNVSKGIVVTDEMLKSAGIVLISSGSVCPGKFVTIVGGELSAIHAAVDRAELIAEDALIDKFVIGNLGDNVFEAICGTADVKEKKAFGIVETFTAASAIQAADAAVKAGDIELIEVRVARGLGGKCFVSRQVMLQTLKQALRQEQELRLNKACLSIQKLLLIHILNCGKLYFNLILRLTKVLRMQYLFYV